MKHNYFFVGFLLVSLLALHCCAQSGSDSSPEQTDDKGIQSSEQQSSSQEGTGSSQKDTSETQQTSTVIKDGPHYGPGRDIFGFPSPIYFIGSVVLKVVTYFVKVLDYFAAII